MKKVILKDFVKREKEVKSSGRKARQKMIKMENGGAYTLFIELE